MDRRRDRRWPRVLDVRFWTPGEEDDARRASATNISRGGIFIRTSTISPTGTRLRVEVIHAHHGFVCEGIVKRAIRTPSHFQSVRPSGMGIRFLLPGELVEELLPHMASVERPATEEATAELAPSKPPPAASTGSADESAPSSPPPARKKAARVVERERPATLELKDREFEIVFRDRERFRAVFDRDVQTGGIFVPTDDPAAMDEVVQIRVRIDGAGSERIEARVVHSVPPSDGGLEGGNLLSGMGVQFSDVARAVERLRRLLSS